MKAEEFNKLMAELAGYKFLEPVTYVKGEVYLHINDLNYYNDLNLLMPLVFKYKLNITHRVLPKREDYSVSLSDQNEETFTGDPIQAIRDCLTAIALQAKDK